MSWFRRGPRSTVREQFTVGVDGHRVEVSDTPEGCLFMEGLDDWVESVSRRNVARPRSDGRDSIALLNAKMDYAEMVGDAVSVVALVFDELVERELFDAANVPERPPGFRIVETRTYEYIQDAHARAVERRAWLRAADSLLVEAGVTVLLPPDPDA